MYSYAKESSIGTDLRRYRQEGAITWWVGGGLRLIVLIHFLYQTSPDQAYLLERQTHGLLPVTPGQLFQTRFSFRHLIVQHCMCLMAQRLN